MNPQLAQNYLRTKVMTATPEQLQMMLFDGCLRFAEQARVSLEKKDYEQTYNLISRVQKILTELSCSLKREVYPELCEKLAALYAYAFKKLIEANTKHEMKALDEAIDVLRYQRETWSILLQQIGKDKAAIAASKMDLPSPNARMEASISMHG